MYSDSYYISEILKKGSEKAIFSLVKKYEKQIFNLCFRIVKNREGAEEMAQDVFLKGFKELKKLDDHTKYEIWINRIAYHMCIDFTRRKKRYFSSLEKMELIGEKPEPLDLLSQTDRVEAIEWALEGTSPEDSGLVTLFYINELSVKEVAEVTKLTESNVKVKLMRIRKHLKDRLTRKMGIEIHNLY